MDTYVHELEVQVHICTCMDTAPIMKTPTHTNTEAIPNPKLVVF